MACVLTEAKGDAELTLLLAAYAGTQQRADD